MSDDFLKKALILQHKINKVLFQVILISNTKKATVYYELAT